MTKPIAIDGNSLRIDDVVDVARCGRSVTLVPEARVRMQESYAWVRKACGDDQPVYGVNTGFGSLARVKIDSAHSSQLSLNLIRSHAAGVGPSLPVAEVRAMMLLRANALAKGASGCRPLLVDTLTAMLEKNVTPIVPSQGSCGSSGDLAPLAHLGLVMADGDHGRVMVNGVEMSATEGMKLAGIPRLTLEAKDGLAITNGAQLTTAIGALSGFDAISLVEAAELAAAMSIEAKAAVQLQEVPLSELERIATVFGYAFAAPPRHLAGGYASCNFAVSLVPLDGSSATPTQAVLKFSNTCIDLADIEHQLRVLSHLQSASYKTNYLLPRRDAAADAPLAARYLATADG
ncbi:MAG: hypothetical protein CL930_06790, partial [Deltaproteobacteria bacterium]|nr:hypothetical protein [Deltaproteobacteria bacterium]